MAPRKGFRPGGLRCAPKEDRIENEWAYGDCPYCEERAMRKSEGIRRVTREGENGRVENRG